MAEAAARLPRDPELLLKCTIATSRLSIGMWSDGWTRRPR